jgi:hypothetical protein
MSEAISLDIPVTWRSVIRIGLLWGAEYAVLSLIEDAPIALKLATVFCALGALVILELETRLAQVSVQIRRIRISRFQIAISVIGLIYAGFIVYAVAHAAERQRIMNGLQKIYITSGSLLNREIIGVTNLEAPDDNALSQYEKDFAEWQNRSQEWIGENVGEAAKERFLDRSLISYLGYGARYNERYSTIRNRLREERNNLHAILESRIYVE